MLLFLQSLFRSGCLLGRIRSTLQLPDGSVAQRCRSRIRHLFRAVDETILHNDGSPALALQLLGDVGVRCRHAPEFSAFTFIRQPIVGHTGSLLALLLNKRVCDFGHGS